MKEGICIYTHIIYIRVYIYICTCTGICVLQKRPYSRESIETESPLSHIHVLYLLYVFILEDLEPLERCQETCLLAVYVGRLRSSPSHLRPIFDLFSSTCLFPLLFRTFRIRSRSCRIIDVP